MSSKKVYMCWSSGKDSCYCLSELTKSDEVEVVGLLTTVSQEFDRVSMHGVRRELLALQAESLGLPLHVIEIPNPCPNGLYEQRMKEMIDASQSDGVTHMAFGDLFLEDVRRYREDMLRTTGIEPLFPLWQRPTDSLARDIIGSGHRAILTCVDSSQLGSEFAGRFYDADLLADLPGNVDPCGENGEFHTFVFDSPLFSRPLSVELGETVDRDGFVFADVCHRTQDA